MNAPANLQDAALNAIDAAVNALVCANRGVGRAIELGRRHGLPDDGIRAAFERAGLDFGGILAAVETGEEQ